MKNSFIVFLVTLLLSSSLFASDRRVENQVLNPPRGFTENELHEYLGIAAVTAGILAGTVFTPKSDKEYGTHESVANLATALSVAAVGTGFYSHYDDLNIDFGIKDPDNQHILMGGVGAALMALAVSNAPDSHASTGMAGVALMLTSITVTW